MTKKGKLHASMEAIQRKKDRDKFLETHKRAIDTLTMTSEECCKLEKHDHATYKDYLARLWGKVRKTPLDIDRVTCTTCLHKAVFRELDDVGYVSDEEVRRGLGLPSL